VVRRSASTGASESVNERFNLRFVFCFQMLHMAAFFAGDDECEFFHECCSLFFGACNLKAPWFTEHLCVHQTQTVFKHLFLPKYAGFANENFVVDGILQSFSAGRWRQSASGFFKANFEIVKDVTAFEFTGNWAWAP
jgi:hypothetical protein